MHSLHWIFSCFSSLVVIYGLQEKHGKTLGIMQGLMKVLKTFNLSSSVLLEMNLPFALMQLHPLSVFMRSHLRCFLNRTEEDTYIIAVQKTQISPFLSVFIFLHHLSTASVCYIMWKFHDKWTKTSASKSLRIKPPYSKVN